MSEKKLDQGFWEQLWSKTVRERGDVLAHRPPNGQLVTELSGIPAGRALDAGCGHGTDTLWLALQGWQVTAVDFSAAALAYGQSMANAAGEHIAERIHWKEADLSVWEPEPAHYDLIVCLYVHIAGQPEDMIKRMAKGVTKGGTLFMIGHQPIDPITGAATIAANQVQVSVEAATHALNTTEWELLVAEERPRAMAGTGTDAVIRARRIR